MTEAEWLAATDPEPMLRSLWGDVSERKQRLSVLAFCRRVWHRLSQPAQHAVEIAERVLDGVASPDSLAAARRSLERVGPSPIWYGDRADEAVMAAVHPDLNAYSWPAVGSVSSPARFAQAACAELRGANKRERKRLRTTSFVHEGQTQTELLRCIFGNPFRPVAFDPRWRSETALALAAGIYEHRHFDRLPILADALEEAGCDHPDVLSHLRGPGPHARGCWPVDLVLGKS